MGLDIYELYRHVSVALLTTLLISLTTRIQTVGILEHVFQIYFVNTKFPLIYIEGQGLYVVSTK